MQKSPYKFLDSYSKEDRDIFFGRDKETEELYSRVFESRILLVYGTSGTGKSSLINCGLANRFNEWDWLPVTVRRGVNINRSLVENLERNRLTEISPGEKASDIVKIIKSVYLDHFRPVYVIFDQFEELFIFGSSEEKEELITSVKKVLDSDLQCRFIFSIREEYLAGVTEFEKVIPTFLSNRIRIERMTRQNAVKVIDGPCRINQINVEDGFPEMLLEKLNPDSQEVELTWLQVYLDRVLRMVSADGKEVTGLTKDLLDRAGEVKDLLGSFLEEQITQLDDPESGLVILKSFVSVKGTRVQITGEEVIEYSKAFGKDLEREKVKDLIQRFIRLRILRDKDENGRYELRHDSLAATIYEKITLVEKELLEIRQLLDDAYNSFEKRGMYLTADNLTYIAPYEDKLFLNDKVSKFISQSKWIIHRAKVRRQRLFVSTAVIIITILSFFTVWALRERSRAIDQEKAANEQRAIAERQKEEADSAKIEAENSRNLAIDKENLAIIAQKQSEEAKNEAIAERRNAFEQKNRAETASETAIEQARIATEEKSRAELAMKKAVEAEEEARRLGFLSVAQNLALKSTAIERDPELMGLLAVQAYVYNKNNMGKPEDPVIYEALNKSFMALDSSKHSVFTGSQNELRILTQKENGLLFSADLDGQIRSWSGDGRGELRNSLFSQSPINFIGCSSNGERIITQHDNHSLFLWDKWMSDSGNIVKQELTHYNGFVRTIAFSDGGNLLATSGRDSSLTLWDLNEKRLSTLKTIKTGSGVRSLVFISSDTLIFAQENGTIVLWDLSRDERKTIFSSENDKTLCLSWNEKRKALVAGCSNGALLILDLIPGNSLKTERHNVHTAGIDLIAFNADFSMMATSSWDRTIKFFYYHDFFDHKNTVGGSEHLRNIDSRARTLIFTSDHRLAASMSDRTVRVWETSSEKLASLICNLLKREMTLKEWNEMVGEGIPYEKSCNRRP